MVSSTISRSKGIHLTTKVMIMTNLTRIEGYTWREEVRKDTLYEGIVCFDSASILTHSPPSNLIFTEHSTTTYYLIIFIGIRHT